MASILLGPASGSRGTTGDFVVAGQIAGFKLVANAAGKLRHVYIHPKVANAALSALEVRLYADSAGAPGAALTPVKTATAGPITAANPIRYDLGADAFDLVSGTTYWVAIRVAGEQFDWQGDAVAGAYVERTTATLPDPFGGVAATGGNALTILGTDAPLPQVLTTSVLADTASVATHNVPYPAPAGGILAGDLLVCFVGQDAAATAVTVGWPDATWTELSDSRDATNAVAGAVAWKRAAGGESGTFAVTTSTARGGGIRCLLIRGAHATQAPELAVATGSSTNPNPPALNPAGWATPEPTLWIAGACNDGNVAITATPAGYTDFANTRWANTSGAGVATAWRYDNADSVDPGTFTMATEQWVAWTVAIRSAAPATTTTFDDAAAITTLDVAETAAAALELAGVAAVAVTTSQTAAGALEASALAPFTVAIAQTAAGALELAAASNLATAIALSPAAALELAGAAQAGLDVAAQAVASLELNGIAAAGLGVALNAAAALELAAITQADVAIVLSPAAIALLDAAGELDVAIDFAAALERLYLDAAGALGLDVAAAAAGALEATVAAELALSIAALATPEANYQDVAAALELATALEAAGVLDAPIAAAIELELQALADAALEAPVAGEVDVAIAGTAAIVLEAPAAGELGLDVDLTAIADAFVPAFISAVATLDLDVDLDARAGLLYVQGRPGRALRSGRGAPLQPEEGHALEARSGRAARSASARHALNSQPGRPQ